VIAVPHGCLAGPLTGLGARVLVRSAAVADTVFLKKNICPPERLSIIWLVRAAPESGAAAPARGVASSSPG
jgi:hypothetical protein